MKKKLTLAMALTLGAITLASCGGEQSSNSSAASSSNSDSSVSPISSSTLPSPNISDESLSYLKGTYFGKEGSLSLNKDALTLTGKKELKLIPTKVGTARASYSVGGMSAGYDTLCVYFDSAYNNGIDYRLYADVKSDGFVHLEEKTGEEYTPVATFQPDVSKYASPVSYDGSGDIYNTYYVFDGEFDFDRDVYPVSFTGNGFWSYEQSWYALSRIRLSSDNEPLYTLEFYDADDYGYGELHFALQEGKVALFDNDDAMNFVSDAGAFRSLSLFDGENNVTLTSDPEAKTIEFLGVSGTYVTGLDEKGFYLKATLGEKGVTLRLCNRYLSCLTEEGEKIYPLDDVSPLVGEFTDKKDTYSFTENEEGGYDLLWNGTKVAYSYVIARNRKALSFKVGEDSYIAAPDKEDSSLYLSKNGEDNYFINDAIYGPLFADTFLAHDETNKFSIAVNTDFAYTYKNQTGKASYHYWHGDKFPSLSLEGGLSIEIKQRDIGYFILKDGVKEVTLYSKAVLDKVFGDYSSNGEDALALNETAITYEGTAYDYEFKPLYQKGTGIYLFAISSEFGTFESNLAGCLYDNTRSFVKTSVFADIAGTYSAYGDYGIENITFKESGKLYLDLVNDSKDGLLRDQPFDYLIMTSDNELNGKAFLAFTYKNNSIFIYFYDDYVKIMGLNYYEQMTTLSWGTYVDESMTHALFVQDDKAYYDGEALTINSKAKTESTITMDTSKGTLVLTKGTDAWTATFDSVNYERKLGFEDYKKFVGEYTANDTTLSVKRDGVSYAITIGGTAVSFSSVTIVIKDNKLAMKIPSALDYFYLSLDAETGEVTATFESGGLLPPPPPPLPVR